MVEVKSGVSAFCAEAFVFHDSDGKPLAEPRVGMLAMLASDLKALGSRGQSTLIAQAYGLIAEGLILTKHVFQGLQRPLRTDGNGSADREKLVYSRKPSFDYAWRGDGATGKHVRLDAPPARVFAVYVSPNVRHREDFQKIDGWINHWAWIDEDAVLSEAPKEWVDRYDSKLWTRQG